jgi:tetratricopeptide (TPR) repeat protein
LSSGTGTAGESALVHTPKNVRQVRPEALVLIRGGGRSLDLGMVVDPSGLILSFERALSPHAEARLVPETQLEARTRDDQTWSLTPVGAHRGLVLLRAEISGTVPIQPVASRPVKEGQAISVVVRGAEQPSQARILSDTGELEFVGAGHGLILLDDSGAIVGTCAAPPAQMIWHLRFLLKAARSGRKLRWPPAAPSLAHTLIRIGDERRRLHNDAAAAMSAYSEALRIDPACATAHFHRGSLLMAARDFAGARQEFTSALKIEQDWDQALFARARIEDHMSELDAALASYNAAIEVNPFYKAALFWRAQLHHRKNRIPQALSDYSAAASLDAGDAMVLAYRGQAYCETGEIEAARADLWEAARLAQEMNSPELLDLVKAQIRALDNSPQKPPAACQPVTEKQLPAHRCKIFLDTSSLMNRQAAEFFKTWLESKIADHENLVLLSTDVIKELRRHQLGTDASKRALADDANRLLAPYLTEGRIHVLFGPEQGATFADNRYLELLQRYCLRFDQTLVTNDRYLAFDALDILRRRSVRTSRSLTVLRISITAAAEDWAEIRKRHFEQRGLAKPIARKPKAEPARKEARPFIPAFRLATGAAFQDNRPLPVSVACKSGDFVKTAAGEAIRLADRIGAGGEGAVFLTSDPLHVCKIYGPAPPRVAVLKKLELMCSRPITQLGCCWPRQLVYNSAGEFAGYQMLRASGKPLQNSLMQPRLFKDLFPNWNRINLVEAAIHIIRAVAILNRNNILLGDINPNNILVRDEKTVYFVDTDSYQIEDFPCPVGLPPFVHPDLIGQDLRTRLRSFEHENFAVSTLVFMLLMPGKSPYSHQGGEGVVINVLNRHFPYKRGNLKPGKGVPRGPWGFIWSHFTDELREEFHQVFTDGQQRSAMDWLGRLERYLAYLKSSRCPVESRAILPRGYRLLPKEVILKKNGAWHTCAQCGAGFGRFPDEKSQTELCLNCRIRMVEAPCKRCGAPVAMTLERYYLRAGKGFRCEACHAAMQRWRQQSIS